MDRLQTGDPGDIGPFRLLGRLGEGGMGRVFVGESRGGRKVAIKVVHPHYANDPEFRRRFAREVAAARQVGGFHTAAVVGADPDADPPWMATAYIAGPSLAEAVAEGGPLDEARVRRLGAALAEGLAAIHDCGLIHRDLKPGNVILADDGPRIIDFGIARGADATALTGSSAVIGTLHYMSPEQLQGQELTPQSDVFALGAVLAFAATGHDPFPGPTMPSVITRILTGPPDLGPIAGDLRGIIAGCLAKDPGGRPAPGDLLARFSRPAPHDPTVAAKPEPAPATAPVPTLGAVPEAAPFPGPRLAEADVPAPAPAAREQSLTSTGTHPSATESSGHPPRRALRRLTARPRMVAIAAGATATALAVAGGATAALSKSASVPVASQSTSAPASSQPTLAPGPAQPASAPASTQSTPAPASSQSTSAPVSRQPAPVPGPSQPASAPAPTLPASAPASSQSAPAPGRSQSTSAPPILAAPAGGCTFGSVCVAANGILTGGAKREQYANDPDVHVAGLETPPAAVGMTIYDIPASGTYTLSVTYENYNASDGLIEPRDMSLLVNGQLAGTLNFAVTGSWYETYSLVSTASIQVPAGHSTFTIACQAGDSCHINVWKVELS